MSLSMILSATLLAAVSGPLGLVLGRSPGARARWAALAMAAAAALGLTGAAIGCVAPAAVRWTAAWPLMPGGVAVEVDALSAFFLVPVFAIGGLGAVYGLGYWQGGSKSATAVKLSLFWGSLIAGMALLLLARQALVFLLGWETMALSAFFLIATEDQEAPARQAAWLYLIATHIGTLCLFAMFVLLRQASGSWLLGPIGVDQAGLGMLTAIFLLALVGFGLKAGLMPLHFWLPSAHANAPSHVSAGMSGVVIKMGIYGLVRITGYLPEPPPAWGAILLTVGAGSGLLGIAFALAQKDLKRFLAYSSIENMGIIAMGLGLALVGRALHQPTWIVFGLGGALLHVWNHSLFKSLLFLCSGSVVAATGTRQMDRLGGLARKMPWTAGLFGLAAVAICGLPPLNGFVGELLLYLGLFQPLIGPAKSPWLAVAVGAPVLAMIGALTVAAFVKGYGTIFLGQPRSASAGEAVESPPAMLWPMGLLVPACLVIGLAPVLVTPVLDASLAAWVAADGTPLAPVASLAPVAGLSAIGVALLLACGLILVWVRRSVRVAGAAHAGTWSCGYAQPSARMQYTSSSFSQSLVRLFGRLLRPTYRRPDLPTTFGTPAEFEYQIPDRVLDRWILPTMQRIQRRLIILHALHKGQTQSYVLFILVTALLLLLTTLPMDQWVLKLFAR